MLKSLTENLRAMGCKPAALDGETVNINNKSRCLPVIAFKTKGSAKASLTKLLKIMSDYAADKFYLCEITESGRVYTVSKEGNQCLYY